jgi:PAS domain S-box-containing protein
MEGNSLPQGGDPWREPRGRLGHPDFRILADALPHIVWLAEPEGAITWFNCRWYEFSGLTPEGSMGWAWRSAWVSGSWPDEERAKAIADGRPWVETVCLRGRDGERRRFSGRAEPIRDQKGNHIGWVGTGTDIEEELRARDELEKLFESLASTVEFRERFLGIVAHDLRNPITSMAAAAGLIQRMDGLPERAVHLSRGIATTALRMGKMISDLMDFTRARLGSGMPIDRAPVELRALVREVVDETAVAYPERQVTLVAVTEIHGEWDGNRLAQVVGNLLKNALDYSPTGTPVTVSLFRERGGGRLLVHNRNAAGAVPREDLCGLFDPFRRTADAPRRNPNGLGLGLYIAREIVLAHGGTIDAESGDDGTTFRVWLPQRPPA